MTCADWHYIGAHKFQYGQHNVSWADDEVPATFECADCHTENPHQNSSKAYKETLDGHVNYLACKTCHSRESSFWKYLEYTPVELMRLKQER